jgi:hypothetical protein
MPHRSGSLALPLTGSPGIHRVESSLPKSSIFGKAVYHRLVVVRFYPAVLGAVREGAALKFFELTNDLNVGD